MKPIYTITELAKLMKMSHRRTYRLLKSLGVPMHLVSTKYVVYLSDLSLYASELVASIIESDTMGGDQ